MLAAKGLPALLPSLTWLLGQVEQAMRQITDLLEQTMSEMQTYYDDAPNAGGKRSGQDFQQRIEGSGVYRQVPDWS